MNRGREPRVERRHLTVLFTDLVSSTRLTAVHGPEVARVLTRDYVAAVRASVQRYDGYVARIVGDGVLIYFGWPTAREDAAECAVLAAQAVHAALEKLSLRRRIDLQCKAAIATGSVVIGAEDGDDDDQASDAYGAAPQLAARLQEYAGPGETIVSDETHGLTVEAFDFSASSKFQLDGFDGLVKAFRLVRRKKAGAGVAPKGAGRSIFGRDDALSVLGGHWAAAEVGQGRAIVIQGDAGIGKSRLVQAFRHKAEIPPAQFAIYRCSRLFANSAYYPLLVSLNTWAGVRQGDPKTLRARRIRSLIEPYLTQQQVDMTLSLAMQSDEGGDRSEVVSERAYRETLEDAYVTLVHAITKQDPLLLHFENAHWADPSTISVVNALIRKIDQSSVFLVLEGRASNGFPGNIRDSVDRLHLDPLDTAASRAMITGSAKGSEFSENLIARILRRSNGVPQFIEAFLGSLTAADDGASPEVPASLRDLLEEQLAQLGELRPFALAASTIGCPFDAPFLAAVAGVSNREAEEAIGGLLKLGVLVTDSVQGDGIFTFAKTLQREAAYGVLVTDDLHTHHGRILRYAEDGADLTKAWQPEFLAHHYQAAGRLNEAAVQWASAAKTALGRFAHHETLDHTERGLALLDVVRDDTTMRAKIDLNASRGAALRATEGPGSPASIKHMQAAFDDAIAVGDSKSILHVGRSLSVAHHVRAQYQDAEFYARQIERHLKDDLIGQMVVRTLLAMPMIWQGSFDLALAELNKADELTKIMKEGRTRLSFESQIKSLRGVAEAFLGNETMALELAHDGVELAKKTLRPQVHASALMLSCNAHQITLNNGTMSVARALQQLATEQRLPFYQASAVSFVAAALYNEGEVDKGFEQLNEGWVAFQATTARANQMLVCRELARGCLMRGTIDEGLIFVDDGLDRAELYQEQNYLAEILRLKGELLERKGAPATECATFYDMAIDKARKQKAALFEKWAIESRLALDLPPVAALQERLSQLGV